MPVSMFISYKRGNKQGGIGVSSRCKKCNYLYLKGWFKSDKGRANKARYHKNVKESIINAYGSQCDCCGEKEMKFLSIDHINGDGNKERKMIGFGGAFYRFLYRNLKKNVILKNKYKVLCFNCNLGRQINGGICPHKF